MRLFSVSAKSEPGRSPAWLVFVLLSLIHTHPVDGLPVPQQVSLSPDMQAQQLTISWLGGAATSFDLMILRTEFNESVLYETAVAATVDLATGRHQWNWTSVEPLECTSLSISVRSREGQTTSDWSKTQILQGKDLPSNDQSDMYPQDRVVPVGANTTFCCIVKEGKVFDGIYAGAAITAKRLSRRSYAATLVNLGASSVSGTNVLCYSDMNSSLSGAVVFVGYPPLPIEFTCETRDLSSAICHWKAGQDTRLGGRKRGTFYSVNNSPPQQARTYKTDKWEGNWTLVAVNPLGRSSLTDQAEITHRVCPVAPDKLRVATQAWNATVQWDWQHPSYSSLALVCQVNILNSGSATTRTFTGVGLRSVVLSDLHPDEEYSVQVRCGAQQNFWRWGDWSSSRPFRTKTTVPDAPDVWFSISSDDVWQVIWKPLTPRQSHGSQITGYEVTFWTPEENVQHRETLAPDVSAVPLNLTQLIASGADRVVATVAATNKDGDSQHTRVIIPLHETDVEPAVSRVSYSEGGFPLSWDSDANATCGYVVQWKDAFCTQPCAPDWIKLAAGSSNVSLESATFKPGVRYNLSLYSCSSEPAALLRHWQGYTQELVPSSSVSLSAHQKDSDIVLMWDEIPLANRRSYILGYNIYSNVDSKLTLLANLSDPEARSFTVKGFSLGTYKFTVKAYTSVGEDTGATASIMLRIRDWLILEILASLGVTALFLVIITFVCYKKRKWVKKAFYPDIPEPKLPGDWSRPQGTLDVKPPPHSMVHIVEKPEWDSSKEMLVVIPEEDEDEEGMGDEPVDTDEPTSLRYYNQVVDERPIRPRFPDSSASSASSLDSARTDVTYTGIQTSGSSLVWPTDPQGSSEGHRPPAEVTVCGDAGGYRPQMQARGRSEAAGPASPEPLLEPQDDGDGGYKPQSSWHFDAAAADNDGLAPSLGSPTSVASTQFLLPDGEDHSGEKRQPSSAASWFSNLLSSSKP